jgi:hypothetical protein
LHDLLSIRRSVYNNPDDMITHSSNHTEHYRKKNRIMSHAQNTNALLPGVFLTGRSAFASANHCQGQLQNFSVSTVVSEKLGLCHHGPRWDRAGWAIACSLEQWPDFLSVETGNNKTMYAKHYTVARFCNHCYHVKATMCSLFLVVVEVVVSNTEVQQCVPFALLHSCKIFRTAANNKCYIF